MGKTHYALERAEKEYQKNILRQPQSLLTGNETIPVLRPAKDEIFKLGYDLKTNLLIRAANRANKIFMFTATAPGAGCTTTTTLLATDLSRDSHLKVLLMDVNPRTPSVHDIFETDSTPGILDVLAYDTPLFDVIKKVVPGNLSVLSIGKIHSGCNSLFESRRFDLLLNKIREHFDYVILDAPPVPIFPESRIIGCKVDAVVLVLECGKARRQVALKAKKELEEAGAKVLGVILNKRKYYIPAWIYKQL
jgi:protein-tyrosine kinase